MLLKLQQLRKQWIIWSGFCSNARERNVDSIRKKTRMFSKPQQKQRKIIWLHLQRHRPKSFCHQTWLLQIEDYKRHNPPLNSLDELHQHWPHPQPLLQSPSVLDHKSNLHSGFIVPKEEPWPHQPPLNTSLNLPIPISSRAKSSSKIIRLLKSLWKIHAKRLRIGEAIA